MGSVPAISVLILGIVVPTLAGYIEVCDMKCSLIYCVPASISSVFSSCQSKSFRRLVLFPVRYSWQGLAGLLHTIKSRFIGNILIRL